MTKSRGIMSDWFEDEDIAFTASQIQDARTLEEAPQASYTTEQVVAGNGARDWKSIGNCVGLDPDLMVPTRGESTDEAKAVCVGCRALDACLEDAIRTKAKGVRGGTSERERKQIIKSGRKNT